MRPSRLFAVLAGLACASALPHVLRQGSSNSTTLVVENTYQTDDGPMTETCTITLTPTAEDLDGQAGVQEDKSCTTAPATVAGASATPIASATAVAPTVPAIVAPSSAAPVSSAAAVSSPAAAAAPPAVSVDGLSSVALSSATPTPASSALGGIATASASATVPSASALADNAPSAAASVTVTPQVAAAVTPFAIPGQHLMVLPVGLVIFCTVTGIGMIVWTVVTVERVLYRKDFRRKRMAEMGAPAGFGGMKA